jgi:hypothetical protein
MRIWFQGFPASVNAGADTSSAGQTDWYLYLLIVSRLIFASRVVRGIPSRVAAPRGPEIRPRLSSSADSDTFLFFDAVQGQLIIAASGS